jgi:hypothetical protein
MAFGAILGAVAGPLISGVVGNLFGGGSSSSPQQQQQTTNAGAGAGAAVGNVLIGQAGANAANTAANQQVAARSGAVNTINYTGAQQQALNQPYIRSGVDATNKLDQATAAIDPNSLTKQFSMADATNSDAESYARQQALGAINNAASVGGTQLSSGNWDALMKASAGIGAQYQNQAFSQNLAQKEFNAGLLTREQAVGQTATNNQTSILGTNADRVANLQAGIGDVQAAGTIGAQEALTGGYSAAANNILGSASGVLNSAGSQIGNVLGLNQPQPGVVDTAQNAAQSGDQYSMIENYAGG